MAEVHEVLEANDKSKFHRQIKNVLERVDKNGMNVSKFTYELSRCLSIET